MTILFCYSRLKVFLFYKNECNLITRPDGCLHQHTVQGDYVTEHGYLDHSLSLVYNGNYGAELLKVCLCK